MDLNNVNFLEIVSKDIYILKDLMYKAKNRTGSLNDPLVIEISQFLDQKLNQHRELTIIKGRTQKFQMIFTFK